MSLTPQAQRLLARAADGVASAAEFAELKRRLEHEPELAQAWHELQRLVGALKALPTFSAPAGLLAGALNANLQPSRARPLWPWLLVPVAAGLAMVGTWLSLRAPEVSAIAELAAATTQVPTLSQAVGDAWLLEAGTRQKLVAGQTLKRGQTLGTALGGSLTLTIASAAVTLHEQSQLVVDEPTEGTPVLALNAGVVQITVAQATPTPTLEVRLLGLPQRLLVEQGALGIVKPHESAATVACLAGQVRVVGVGETVVVVAGQELALASDAAHSLRPTPTALFLALERIAAPDRDGQIIVRGRTNPGVELRLNHRLIPVGADGRFSYAWRPDDTERNVTVAARDALNRQQQAQTPLPRAARPRPHAAPGETQWEWTPRAPG